MIGSVSTIWTLGGQDEIATLTHDVISENRGSAEIIVNVN